MEGVERRRAERKGKRHDIPSFPFHPWPLSHFVFVIQVPSWSTFGCEALGEQKQNIQKQNNTKKNQSRIVIRR